MTRALVVYGSRMGCTKEIAEEIGATLRGQGVEADVLEATHAAGPERYDAVVVGSAIYAARWRPEVVAFLKREAKALAPMPVWIFHDGPLDHEAEHAEQPLPKKVRTIVDTIGVRGVATFGGRLDAKHAEGFFAKAMTKKMAGDFRDWLAIRAWAKEIATEMQDEARAKSA